MHQQDQNADGRGSHLLQCNRDTLTVGQRNGIDCDCAVVRASTPSGAVEITPVVGRPTGRCNFGSLQKQPPGSVVTSISTGGQQTCIVVREGGLYCAGANGSQLVLGIGTSDLLPHPGFAQLNGPYAVVFPTGVFHNCALATDGTAWCWGSNTRGQVGWIQVNAAPRKSAYPRFPSQVALDTPRLPSDHRTRAGVRLSAALTVGEAMTWANSESE